MCYNRFIKIKVNENIKKINLQINHYLHLKPFFFSSVVIVFYGFNQTVFQYLAINELFPKRLEIQRNNNIFKDESGYVLGNIKTIEVKNKTFNTCKIPSLSNICNYINKRRFEKMKINLTKITYLKDGKTIDWIDEYDKNGKIVKKTLYNFNGTINSITEFSLNSIRIKSTHYQKDGKKIKFICEYDSNGKKTKSTYLIPDGKTISAIIEFDKQGQRVKATYYPIIGGKGISHIAEYKNNIINKETYYFYDGKTIDWINEYDKNGKIVKKTPIQFQRYN
ncbi:conserved hypothetical protein [Aster yellows witches'-broom phytoplasma AYWB]|uniref:DUF2963 domain-containing protein n=1 Tax=Aster yellows witches'-broom phytoplasma (strain AYWB) TaxID=322098 RepID=Q2NIL1_AYWBP|nr:DUF2963 domain-containing protein [Aster yellows witches'-broom phytoplasma]ABC65732.1 conserved hypothetical protein [Aster yellows witches'-broom phytoplasma AYWB]